jgi:CheY-like chemotaxis protein
MPREILARVFEPFFTTKEIGHGTGLGLSQVYGFVKQSGGHVKIYSEVGEGTSVKLYLPRLHSEDAQIAAAPESEAAAPRSSTGQTILVVEDEQDVRTYSTSIVRELGYRVLEASNAAAALQLLADHPETMLLFTDVGLPGGMNGRQVADAGRSIRKGLKTLFITGYAENSAIGHGHLDLGMEILARPFALTSLGNKVREMLEI